jgi:hypothetical protein
MPVSMMARLTTLRGRDELNGLRSMEISMLILLHVHPLLGNGLVNKFPRRQIPGKQSIAKSRNNRTDVYSSLLGNNQPASVLAR